MASLEAYANIKALLETVVSPVTVIDWDEIDSATQQGSNSFVALEEDSAEESDESLGDPQRHCIRENGSLTAHVFVPSASSAMASARTLGDQIRTGLRHRVLADGVSVLRCHPPIPGLEMEGLWTSAEVGIEYERDQQVDIT